MWLFVFDTSSSCRPPLSSFLPISFSGQWLVVLPSVGWFLVRKSFCSLFGFQSLVEVSPLCDVVISLSVCPSFEDTYDETVGGFRVYMCEFCRRHHTTREKISYSTSAWYHTNNVKARSPLWLTHLEMFLSI